MKRFIPIAFATLTAPNSDSFLDKNEILSVAGAHLVGAPGVVGTYQYIQRVGFATNTHIAALVGYETTLNTHSHLILHVPEDEAERFHSRAHRINGPDLYGWERHSHFELWDGERGNAYSYVGRKHSPWVIPSVCPRYYNRCRKGMCEWDRSIPCDVAEYRDISHTAHQ